MMTDSPFLCRLLGHKFAGWPAQVGYAERQPLPTAHCERCGKEL